MVNILSNNITFKMFNLIKTFAICVCARCVADTLQHGVLFLFGEGINSATYFDVSKPLEGFTKKLEIQLVVLNSSTVIKPIKDSERRLDFQIASTETVKGKLIHIFISCSELYKICIF